MADYVVSLSTEIDLSRRADLASNPEQMDQPCAYADLRECLLDIAEINRLTFAYRPTLHWLNHVHAVLPRLGRPLQILDVGCGYGDGLRRIRRWAFEKNLPVVLTGIDRNPQAIRAARKATHPGENITFLEGDIFSYEQEAGVDIVVSSLLTHHFEDPQIVRFLDWMESNARLGWFVNDLHRQQRAYTVFRLASRFMGWHRFVKHDGAVSILRSFRAEDWRRLATEAALSPDTYQIREYRPARLCVARVKLARLR
ncbi:Methyltransferase domain-containing protein [Granulicella rosea]|uniref:Methyltransferase domain-containing protein n=1 Tax=Granulicella rosea TaxID=474952 RepID=A0A239KQW7_9BACT|nr:methyltransferase domain-containing protein [Granulicella rosea]SNT20756.1 Methyltransferase domain-containing protein [Granulicella rosea]